MLKNLKTFRNIIFKNITLQSIYLEFCHFLQRNFDNFSQRIENATLAKLNKGKENATKNLYEHQ